MLYIIITNFLPVSLLRKDHSMIETHRLKNVVIFFKIILSLVLYFMLFLLAMFIELLHTYRTIPWLWNFFILMELVRRRGTFRCLRTFLILVELLNVWKKNDNIFEKTFFKQHNTMNFFKLTDY